MRIDEVVMNDADELDEADSSPYKIGDKINTAFQSMNILNRDKRIAAQGQRDVGKRANELYNAFSYWASRNGTPMNNVPKATITKWLTAQGLPPTLPAFFKTMPLLDLTDKTTSTNLWNGLAQGAYGAQMKAGGGAPGQADTFGQQFGLPSKPTPPPPPPPAPPKMSPKQQAALDKAIKGLPLNALEQRLLRKLLPTPPKP
jgi:hypothetical protein